MAIKTLLELQERWISYDIEREAGATRNVLPFLSLFFFFTEHLPLVAAKAKHHGLKYPQGCHGVSRVRNVYELLPACVKTAETIYSIQIRHY